jgi:hypothetical protein
MTSGMLRVERINPASGAPTALNSFSSSDIV